MNMGKLGDEVNIIFKSKLERLNLGRSFLAQFSKIFLHFN